MRNLYTVLLFLPLLWSCSHEQSRSTEKFDTSVDETGSKVLNERESLTDKISSGKPLSSNDIEELYRLAEGGDYVDSQIALVALTSQELSEDVDKDKVKGILARKFSSATSLGRGMIVDYVFKLYASEGSLEETRLSELKQFRDAVARGEDGASLSKELFVKYRKSQNVLERGMSAHVLAITVGLAGTPVSELDLMIDDSLKSETDRAMLHVWQFLKNSISDFKPHVNESASRT